MEQAFDYCGSKEDGRRAYIAVNLYDMRPGLVFRGIVPAVARRGTFVVTELDRGESLPYKMALVSLTTFKTVVLDYWVYVEEVKQSNGTFKKVSEKTRKETILDVRG